MTIKNMTVKELNQKSWKKYYYSHRELCIERFKKWYQQNKLKKLLIK